MSGADWGEIIGIVLLLLVVAMMAASETAITRTNRVHAYHLVEEGKRGAPSLQRTSDTVRGTSTLVGDVVVGPVAKAAGMAVAASTLVKSLTTISRGGRR